MLELVLCHKRWLSVDIEDPYLYNDVRNRNKDLDVDGDYDIRRLVFPAPRRSTENNDKRNGGKLDGGYSEMLSGTSD